MPRPLKLTPMLEQYFEIKRQVDDAILFYRLGDFYEMFFEDAERAAPILDLVLTARGRGGDSEAPMCGVPYHSAEAHIARLVRHGYRVAICEQVEDPAAAKGLVRREVVRVVTPGTAIEGSIVSRDDSCYLVSFAPGDLLSAAYLDVSTGDFFVTSYTDPCDPRLRDDVARFEPREAVFPRDAANGLAAEIGRLGIVATPADDETFSVNAANDFLTRHFSTRTLRGFGFEDGDPRIGAAGAALRYASTSHKRELDHVRGLRIDRDADYLQLDCATLENLEVFESKETLRPRASLWAVLNRTRTAMGARALRRWLSRPLRDRGAILERHDGVDELIRHQTFTEEVRKGLGLISDLERLATRITLRTATPRECLALADSITGVAAMETSMRRFAAPLLEKLRSQLDPLADVRDRIVSTISEMPALSARDGGVIREGIDQELDDLRSIARDSKSILLQIESDERTRTGISSLKVRFNNVFGYYIEISKSNLAKVPPDYIRKQTLVNAERYITSRLKELEEKILGSEEKSIALEVKIFEGLLSAVATEAGRILSTASAVADVDALASLADAAVRNRFCRPQLSDQQLIRIRDGRHPIVEALSQERFIPNSTEIVRDQNGIQIITGPNMGGKSTYLKQVAIIVLLSQVGSFVPAAEAELAVFDRIFTRVGASDNLARGESTFMVEMHETANILNNSTDKSLVILDEVGRGTATFDGLSLAWAIVEFLHDDARSPITLFATHYHEVTDLAKTKPRVTNFNVTVKEWNEQIIFLRKVEAGAADKSYGIQVAKLAGIPASVIFRAREILATLERKERDVLEETRKSGDPGEPSQQLSLFEAKERELGRRVRALEPETMSPLTALNELFALKKLFTE